MKVWAIAVFVVTTLLFVASFVLNALVGGVWDVGYVTLLAFYVFPLVGLIIAIRRTGNRIAWICLGVGLAVGAEGAGWGIYHYGLANPAAIRSPEIFAVVGSSMIIPGVFTAATFLLLLFPDGRLPSKRWRWVAWPAASMLGVGFVTEYFSPEPGGWGRPEGIENPLVADPDSAMGAFVGPGGILEDAFFVVLIVAVLGSAAAAVVRFRRSTGIEKQQLKWFVFSASIVVVSFLISIDLASRLGEEVGLVAAALFALLPISMGIAILRHRLYDIDRLISRTVSYAVVAGTLAAVYAAIAIGLPRLTGVPGENPVLVAGATLAAAALFNPLRRRIQERVDRRFNRARYDAQHEVEEFAERLRDELDLDDLSSETLRVVADTVQPTTASLWIKEES